MPGCGQAGGGRSRHRRYGAAGRRPEVGHVLGGSGVGGSVRRVHSQFGGGHGERSAGCVSHAGGSVGSVCPQMRWESGRGAQCTPGETPPRKSFSSLGGRPVWLPPPDRLAPCRLSHGGWSGRRLLDRGQGDMMARALQPQHLSWG